MLEDSKQHKFPTQHFRRVKSAIWHGDNVSSSAGAVTEVFRAPHFQEHKVSGMLLSTPLQLHLNLGMPLQNYIAYSFFLPLIFGELPSYIFVCPVCHAHGHDTGYERFLQNCILYKTICQKCASLPFLGSFLKICVNHCSQDSLENMGWTLA